MRKLASIQKVVWKRPIEGADRIETIGVLGWELVAKKDEFQVGSDVVYIEVDSILPDKPEFEFMRERKFKVKTIKLRKQISQGIAFPLSILPSDRRYAEGDDVTELIGVTKYDPQADEESAQESSVKKGKFATYMYKYAWFRKLHREIFKKKSYRFPEWVVKTDEDRIQTIRNLEEKVGSNKLIVTEKLDGCSATYTLKREKRVFWWQPKYAYFVCSRNVNLKRDGKHYWKISDMFSIEKKVLTTLLERWNLNSVTLQGEILGEGIQKNKYGIKGHDFYVHNLYLDDKRKNPIEAKALMREFGIKHVPILDDSFMLLPSTAEMVEYSKGKSTIANVLREGVVIRDYSGAISFKVINPEFLLKNDE